MGSNDATPPPKTAGHRHAKAVWWKRPLPWVGAVMTATVIAIATAFGTGIGQKLSSAATGSPASTDRPAPELSASMTESAAQRSTRHVPTATASSSTRGDKQPSTLPVIIEDTQVDFYEDYSFVSPAKLVLTQTQLAPLDRQAASGKWLQPPGMIMANQQWIILTLAGNSDAPVTINNMTIAKSCQAAITGGTLFYSPLNGGGPYPVAPIYFNLDEPASVGQYLPTAGSTLPPGGNYFAKDVVTLRYHEPQTFAIYLTTGYHFCRFTFQLSVATVNGPVTETITDNGQPFELTADGETTNALHGGYLEYYSPGRIPFSNYVDVYAGGVADRQRGYKFIRVNPAAYHGVGNPSSFTPS